MTARKDAHHHQLSQAMDGFRLSQCIHVVARLRIADAIHAAPRSTRDIAESIGVDEDALRRLLRALVTFGIFERAGDDAWVHTPTSRLLRSDDPSALADRAITLGSLAWMPWGDLAFSIRTGKPAFDHVHGEPFFSYLEENPELAASFGRTMTSFTRQTAEAVATAHDFASYRSLVDVGGGHGVMLDVLLSAHPHLEGTIVDRPEVVEARAPALRDEVRARCTLHGADFFQAELPRDADAYLLSWILHDWDDRTCVRLLEQCRRSMSESSELLVVEMVVEADDAPSPAKMFDLEMLLQTGGRERTEAEYGTLLTAAGLALVRCQPTGGPHCVLVARPAS